MFVCFMELLCSCWKIAFCMNLMVMYYQNEFYIVDQSDITIVMDIKVVIVKVNKHIVYAGF